MTSTDADLFKRSKKLELQESQKYKFSPAGISAFEALLLDVYALLHPREDDYEHRRNLVHKFDIFAKRTYGCNDGFPTVKAFGSFVMDMFTATSDLDLSLNFSGDETSSFPREKKISILRKLSKIFYAQQRIGNMSGVSPIMKARVPVLKVVDRGTGIECDISVENKDGISRSLVINLMCLVDERFRILSCLMKAWAKAHDINSAKDHTLSSLSIILLVAFHLQTRDPPILPPFSALLRDGSHPDKVEKVIHGFKHYGRANRECIAELFISLLSKLSSVRSFWELGLCASIYEGSWICKTWNSGSIGVEDFLDRSQNCARAVGKLELPEIYSCIDSSLGHLVRFMNGQMEGSELEILLFGPASLHTRDEHVIPEEPRNLKRSFPFHDSATAPDNAKRLRYTEPAGRPEQFYSQIPRETTFYPKHFVPLHQRSIAGQLDEPRHLLESPGSYNLFYHKPLASLLPPALACRPHHLSEFPPACNYHSHDHPPLGDPILPYELGHQPPQPFASLGLQSHQQPPPPLVSHDLHYGSFHELQPLATTPFTLDTGLHTIRPTPWAIGSNIFPLGYDDQYPGQLCYPFYRG